MLEPIKRALADWRERRRLLGVARCSLSEVIEATEVRVVGLARPLGPVLEAPLSKRLCVCHAVVVYDWHHDGSVRVIRTAQDRSPFTLLDGELHAVVDPARSRMSALFDHETTILPLLGNSRQLELLGLGDRDWSETRALEASEAIIELDERIAVIGTATRELDPEAAPSGYRDGGGAAVPTRLRIFPSAISDDPRLFR